MPVPDDHTPTLPVRRLAAEGETRVPEVEERVAVDRLLAGFQDLLSR